MNNSSANGEQIPLPWPAMMIRGYIKKCFVSLVFNVFTGTRFQTFSDITSITRSLALVFGIFLGSTLAFFTQIGMVTTSCPSEH